jgi:tetratricopeptide (TPR) repeat protein
MNMPTEMTVHELRLAEQLSPTHRQAYDHLRGNIEEYILDFVAMNIRYFTSHGKKHSLGVVQQIASLLPDAVRSDLSSTEALVLLCAAWLHDVGLLVNRDQTERTLDYDEIRARHHELGRDVIIKTYAEAGIPDHNLASLIGDVCYCHSRKVDIEGYFPQARLTLGRDLVRPRFLAALLRLADALDVGESRAPARMMRKLAEFPLEARLHWDICRVMRVGYDDETISVSATARKDEHQTAEDYRRLFYCKFGDLADEFRGVRPILQAHGLPYTALTGYLNYYPDDGAERQVEVVRDNAIPLDEVFPLEVILYEQIKRKHLEQEQFLFAADWDYQAACLYEKDAGKDIKKVGVPSERSAALERAQEHYEQARDLVRQEIPRQPPERYFLKTLEMFFELKAWRCAGEALTESEELFLAHMRQVHRALDRLEEHQAFIESSALVLPPFIRAGRSPLRPPLKRAFDAYRSLIAQSSNGSIHHGCCMCTARATIGFALAGFAKDVERSVTWLQERAEYHWRSITHPKSAKPVEMGHEYTALAMRAFLEIDDLEAARQVAIYLLDESTTWEDWEQLHPGNIMSDGVNLENAVRALQHCLRRRDDLVPDGISQLAIKLEPLMNRIYSKLRAGQKTGNPAHILRQLLLWNDKDLIPDEETRQFLKDTVCRNIQNAYEHPVWSKDGSWGFNPYSTTSYVLQAFTFWEYYLLGGGTLDEFIELAPPGTGW